MKVTLKVPIKKTGGGIRIASKGIDICFAPPKDMSVEDVAWEGDKKVTGTTLSIDPNTSEPTLYVYLDSEYTKDENDQDMLVEQYKGCEWNVI